MGITGLQIEIMILHAAQHSCHNASLLPFSLYAGPKTRPVVESATAFELNKKTWARGPGFDTRERQNSFLHIVRDVLNPVKLEPLT
jgi:hypothetical protein